MSRQGLRVTIWNEHVHEREDARVAAISPDGIHGALGAAVQAHRPGDAVIFATLADPEQGLGDGRLAGTDVLVWWGHMAQEEVADERAEAVRRRVPDGMGLVVLHSGHLAKPFRLLMGTACMLRWREADDRCVMWTVEPGHPLAAGVPNPLVIPADGMYCEPFGIPAPDELVFVSSYSGGEVLRGGCCFRRGSGRIVYLSPGHETYPVYHQDGVRRLIANAVGWAAAPEGIAPPLDDAIWSPPGWYDR
ncbi:MAG TPA: ThuA domain-containing protein [Gaiellales bacterium]